MRRNRTMGDYKKILEDLKRIEKTYSFISEDLRRTTEEYNRSMLK
jgi:hypothetical protein